MHYCHQGLGVGLGDLGSLFLILPAFYTLSVYSIIALSKFLLGPNLTPEQARII